MSAFKITLARSGEYVSPDYPTSVTLGVYEDTGSALMTFESSDDQKLGVQMNEDGTFQVGTWDEEGIWVDLSLVTFMPPGHLAVRRALDEFRGELQ